MLERSQELKVGRGLDERDEVSFFEGVLPSLGALVPIVDDNPKVSNIVMGSKEVLKLKVKSPKQPTSKAFKEGLRQYEALYGPLKLSDVQK